MIRLGNVYVMGLWEQNEQNTLTKWGKIFLKFKWIWVAFYYYKVQFLSSVFTSKNQEAS